MKTNLNRTKTVQLWSMSSILNPHIWRNEVKTSIIILNTTIVSREDPLLTMTRLKHVFIYHFAFTRYETVV